MPDASSFITMAKSLAIGRGLVGNVGNTHNINGAIQLSSKKFQRKSSSGCSGSFAVIGHGGGTATCNGTTCSGVANSTPFTATQINVVAETTFNMIAGNGYSFVNCSGQDIDAYVDNVLEGTLLNNSVLVSAAYRNNITLEFRSTV